MGLERPSKLSASVLRTPLSIYSSYDTATRDRFQLKWKVAYVWSNSSASACRSRRLWHISNHGAMEGQFALAGPLPIEFCLHANRLLASETQLNTDCSATAGTRDGGPGVVVACGDSVSTYVIFAAQRSPHRLQRRCLPFNSSWNGPSLTTPTNQLRYAPTFNRSSIQLNTCLYLR